MTPNKGKTNKACTKVLPAPPLFQEGKIKDDRGQKRYEKRQPKHQKRQERGGSQERSQRQQNGKKSK